ncbi:MAG: PD-(D/E)XK nuclease family protein [Planctomycetota bacterium]
MRELADRFRARKANPAELARTLRIVVPSHSLRSHLGARIAHASGPTAGATVSTLTSYAGLILARAGRPAPRGAALFEVSVRRAARAEPALVRELGHLDEPYAAVVATIADFFDAGFEPALAPALLEAADVASAPPSARARAAALVRTAERAATELARDGFGKTAALFAAAANALHDAPSLLRNDEIWIHGFLDATGRALDLLELLARAPGTRVVHDDVAELACGSTFGARVRERLGVPPARVAVPPKHEPELLRATDPSSELRAVAERIHALLERGLAPEAIALVARDLDPWRAWIRVHFGRLAIPYAAPGTPGFADRAARRALRVAEFVQRGAEIETERALDLLDMDARAQRALLLAARKAGAAHLRAFDAPRARALEAAQAALPRRAVFAEHSAALARWLDAPLAWPADSRARAHVELALDTLSADVPADFELDAEEFARLFAQAVSAAIQHAPPEGVHGAGGVQCLSVTEARARTFEHVFVVGLNQGAFPRRVALDPLLSDELRTALAAVLPDLPAKRAGHDEEHVLFESLVRAGRAVTLSWSDAGADGRELLTSPFVAAEQARATPAPAVFALHASAGRTAPRPAHEWAILAGLAGAGDGFEAALALALEEARAAQGFATPPAHAIARARVLASHEIDSAPGRGALGPYFGFTGALGPGTDPRHKDPYVTALERLAACPWRTLVTRMLRIDRLPDPLLEPTLLDARVLGITVHRALDELQRAPAPIDAVLLSTARVVLAEEGGGPQGLAPILAAEARRQVDVALAWLAAHPSDLVATEADGAIEIACDIGTPHAHALRFRADRVERVASATITTDFKTGAPLSTAAKDETRRKHMLAALARAELLQGAAYARAAGPGGIGRYLYLDPDLAAVHRSVELAHDDAQIEPVFRTALRTLFSAWHAGAFVPRLLESDLVQEPRACELCSVSEACIRGDSGARARLRAWIGTARGNPDLSTPERALIELWDIGRSADGGTTDGDGA